MDPRTRQRLRVFVQTAVCNVVLLAALYYVAASAVYAIRHPELTHTQVTLDFWDAMRWR